MGRDAGFAGVVGEPMRRRQERENEGPYGRRAFDFAGNLSLRARQFVTRRARTITLEAGQVVQLEGDTCDAIALIETGEIGVYKMSEKGREICLYHVRSGEACALAICCALTGQPYPATAKAVGSVTALALPSRLFLELAAREPALSRRVAHLLAQRLLELTTLVSEIAFEDVDQRLARYLLHQTGGTGATVQSTHAAIAAELGTVREVVTRALEWYASNGWVKIGRGVVTVEDRAALRSLFPGE